MGHAAGKIITNVAVGAVAGKVAKSLKCLKKAEKAAVADYLEQEAATAGRGGGKWTKEVVERKSRGADGAISRHIIEKLNGKTNSVTHQVIKEGKVIHQHQTHIGKYGTRRQFPDEWIEYPRIPPGGKK